MAWRLGGDLCGARGLGRPSRDGRGARAGYLGKLGNWIMGLYRRLLEFTLSARFLVLGATIMVALSAVALFPSIDEELLHTEDRGAILIMIQGVAGSSPAERVSFSLYI